MITLSEDEALANAIQHHALDQTGTSIEGVITAIFGLHNTDPVSPYLTLLARHAVSYDRRLC